MFHILVFRFGGSIRLGKNVFWESGSVTTKVTAAVGFAQENKGRFVEELKALLRIPSISTDPERVGDVRRAARFVAGGLERELAVNVRVIIEGEEEVGGEGIANFVRTNGEQLKADVALVSDTEMFAPELPTLCVGLRGMIYTEIEARGARTDLHSGMYGGAAPIPFVALAQMLA